MAYDFDAPHKMDLVDGATGDLHVFHYTMPGNGGKFGRVAFSKACSKMKGRKVDKEAVIKARLWFGASILSGFEKGSFRKDGKLISSDPADPDFYPDWKKLLVNKRGDLVASLAFQVYEASGQDRQTQFMNDDESADLIDNWDGDATLADDDDVLGDDPGGDDADPLQPTIRTSS
jgi:hypothetical protein